MSCGVGVLAESSTTLKTYFKVNCHLKEPHFMNICHTYTNIKGICWSLFNLFWLRRDDMQHVLIKPTIHCLSSQQFSPPSINFRLPTAQTRRLVDVFASQSSTLTTPINEALLQSSAYVLQVDTTTQGMSVVFGWWLLARKMRWYAN